MTSGRSSPGKWADLVIVDADPLADIRNTRRISAVLQGGRVVDRAAIRGSFESHRTASPGETQSYSAYLAAPGRCVHDRSDDNEQSRITAAPSRCFAPLHFGLHASASAASFGSRVAQGMSGSNTARVAASLGHKPAFPATLANLM